MWSLIRLTLSNQRFDIIGHRVFRDPKWFLGSRQNVLSARFLDQKWTDRAFSLAAFWIRNKLLTEVFLNTIRIFESAFRNRRPSGLPRSKVVPQERPELPLWPFLGSEMGRQSVLSGRFLDQKWAPEAYAISWAVAI